MAKLRQSSSSLGLKLTKFNIVKNKVYMKSFYRNSGKIRKTVLWLSLAVLLFYCGKPQAQNVGITDAASLTPQSLLHIYKNSAGPHTLLQLANSTVGSGANVGLTFDVDASFNVSLNNRATTSLGFNTSGTSRMTISSGGFVGINASPVTNYQLKVSNASTTLGDATIYGEATGNAQTYGVYGNTTSITANGSGVYGTATGATGSINGVWGYVPTSTSGSGVYGLGYDGVYGKTLSATGAGIFGDGTFGYGGMFTSGLNTILGTVYSSNTDINGTAVYATNNAASGAGTFGDAIEAFTAQSASAALWGQNTNAAGTGIMASGNNVGTNFLAAGSGGAFTGTTYGAYTRANNTSGQRASICAISYSGTGVQQQLLLGAYSAAGTQYKVWGTGTVSTVVNGYNGKVTLHAPETPEIYFMDYGQAKLKNGKCHIEIDSILSKNITINDNHPLRVFVQLEGDCKGVYVTNKTSTGFDVIELDGGKSNVSFQWNIVANRADDFDDNGNLISKYADVRFESGPIIEKSETRKEIKKDKKVIELNTERITKIK